MAQLHAQAAAAAGLRDAHRDLIRGQRGTTDVQAQAAEVAALIVHATSPGFWRTVRAQGASATMTPRPD